MRALQFLFDTGVSINAIALDCRTKLDRMMHLPNTIANVWRADVTGIGQVILQTEIEQPLHPATIFTFEMGPSAEVIPALDFIGKFDLYWYARLGHIRLKSEVNASLVMRQVCDAKKCPEAYMKIILTKRPSSGV